MRINLISGATGLVGSHICATLLKKGERVVALKRPSSSTKWFKEVMLFHKISELEMEERLEWKDVDLLDPQEILDVMNGVDVVYHCAAMVSFRKADQAELMTVNVEGTANMVNAALSCENPPIFCHISSTSAIGKGESDVVDESLLFDKDEQHTYYGYTKFLAELEVERARQEGLRSCIINPSIILGYGDPNRGPGMLFGNAQKEFPFFSRGTNGFVDVLDVAESAIALVDHEVFEGRYLCVGWNTSFEELQKTMASALGKKAPKYAVNKKMAYVAAFISALGELVGKKGLVTSETARNSQNHIQFDGTALMEITQKEYREMTSSLEHHGDAFKKFFKK